MLLWLALPAFASLLLLATTNHVCQDVPAIPVSVGRAAKPLSGVVHHRLRSPALVRRLPCGLAALIAVYLAAGMSHPTSGRPGWLGPGSDSWIGTSRRDPDSPWLGYQAAHRLPVRRAVGSVPDLPRRAGAAAASPALSDQLLPDDRGRRSAGGPVGQRHGARCYSTRYAEWKIGLVAGFSVGEPLVTFLPPCRSAAAVWRDRAASGAGGRAWPAPCGAGACWWPGWHWREIVASFGSDDSGELHGPQGNAQLLRRA